MPKLNKILVLSNSNLIIFAFATVFYSRILASTIRFSLLNLFHFIVIPVVCIIALSTTRTRDSKQISLCWSFIAGLFLLFGTIIASAVINHTGLINAIVSFMMLGEPFMFLLAIACVPMSLRSFIKVRNFLYWGAGINFLLAFFQKPLIDAGRISAGGLNGTDGCGGVFFVSGAGNYISATVSFVFALYFFTAYRGHLWIKIAIMFGALFHIWFSDSKQIILAYGVAWMILILINVQDIVKTLQLLIAFLFIGFIGIWCAQNIEAFNAYTSWARPELYGENGLAWYAKFYAVNSILAHYQSPLNLLLGLGPGHTISRLGAWFLRDYASILAPLGSTTTSIGPDTMSFIANFWLTSGSSLFSPIFGWAGIWGDLGLFGLAAYFYLAFLVWSYFGSDRILKLNLLSIFVMGWIFTQLEEPGYMLSIAYILGLAWQEKQIARQTQRLHPSSS
jgi:hypothetical protein